MTATLPDSPNSCPGSTSGLTQVSTAPDGKDASGLQPPIISVILPVLNEAGFIEPCLRRLQENTIDPDKVEILVIDGGSTDGTREIVTRMSREDPRIRLLDNPNRIIATAINIGFEAARGEVLVRMDGHGLASHDFFERNLEVLKEQPDAWCVGGPITTISETFVGKAISSAMSSPAGVGNATFRLGNYEGFVDTLAFGAYRKECVKKVGPIDEKLPRTEDDDFHFRIHQLGGKIYMSSRIQSEYYCRSSFSKLARQYYQYGYWRVPTIMKHRQPTTVRQLVPLVFILSWIVLLLATILDHPVVYALAAFAGLYLLALLAGTIHVALKKAPSHAILAPIAFALLHFSYGIGSLVGVWRFVVRRGKGAPVAANIRISR